MEGGSIQTPAPTVLVPLVLALVISRDLHPHQLTVAMKHRALRSCVISIFSSILFYAVSFGMTPLQKHVSPLIGPIP